MFKRDFGDITGQPFWTQVNQRHMRVGATRHNRHTAIHQRCRQDSGIADDCLDIGLKFWPQCFGKGRSLARDCMHQRPALQTGEYS